MKGSERYVCVHGHFYQPPRESPWLEAIEQQDSAAPYHDWNERITAECYAPNAAARLHDAEDRIARIVNNYARISFNFGPTLLAWMERRSPDVHAAVVEADRASARRFGGHGSAMAQAYNHIIMPLASARDKRTQVRWGAADFERRFGRRPEGMWLPETAVDTETLEALAEEGIAFTVLAPRQAARVREIGKKDWIDVRGGSVDPSMAYRVNLPSGRAIDVLFYDGPVSQAVAFERLLTNGEHFARRLVSAFDPRRTSPQLVHIATDGETYGHHHKHGEMALAYALRHIEAHGLAKLTNYGEFLERHPPVHEAEILENTSWSCAHGVERWRSDCGCRSGSPGWNQAWRRPLREALDALRDWVAAPYERAAGTLFADPWGARDAYIDVVLDRSHETIERFFRTHARLPLSPEERSEALGLLELQRNAMLMYTSCGWFFDDLSNIETVQVLQYAGRVVELGEKLFGASLEAPFLEALERGRSNLPEMGDGRRIWERQVRKARVDLVDVTAHCATSLIQDGPPSTYCYDVCTEDVATHVRDGARLILGRATVTSRLTFASQRHAFYVLHFGDHRVAGGVRPDPGDSAHAEACARIVQSFEGGDTDETRRQMYRACERTIDSLDAVFRDDQRRIIEALLAPRVAEVESVHRDLFERYAPVLRHLAPLRSPAPRALVVASEFVIGADLLRAAERVPPDVMAMRRLMAQAKEQDLRIDREWISFALERSIEALAERMRDKPTDPLLIAELDMVVELAQKADLRVNLWRTQNVFYRLAHSVYPEVRMRAHDGDATAYAMAMAFGSLAERLRVLLPADAVLARLRSMRGEELEDAAWVG
jgi:alpha-amylase/alpha-mannosidase (GH57 family)